MVQQLRQHLRSIPFQLVTGFLLVTIPLIALLLYSNQYAIQVVRNQTAASNQTTVDLYMDQIDRSLEEVDQYLFTTAVQEIDLIYLRLQESLHRQAYNKAKIRVYNKLSSERSSLNQVDTLFIYAAGNEDLLITPLTSYAYEDREAITGDILQLFHNKAKYNWNQESWSILQSGELYFLYRILYTDGIYIGALVNTERLLAPLSGVNQGNRGTTVMTTSQGFPMNHSEIIMNQPGLNLSIGQDMYRLTGEEQRFLIVGDTSTKGAFNLVTLIPDKTILEKLPLWQRIFYSFVLGAVVLVALFLVFLRKIILRPIHNMVRAMKQVSTGTWSTRFEDKSASNEFELMNRTFNSMVSQIEHLKISVYEEKLNLQQAELKQMQLQVNPHFFLNSLNIIYSLARVQDYALIKEMSMCLVKYFRYTFRSGMSHVILKEELEHIHNYLKIQELRFPERLTFNITAEEDAMEQLIPLLMIQPFVENAIKHAFVMNQPLLVEVHASIRNVENHPRLYIRVQDNGKGFSQEVLAKLQVQSPPDHRNGEHIGIWNIQRRLQLMGAGSTSLHLSNGEWGGACIEMEWEIHDLTEKMRTNGGDADAAIVNPG